MSKLRVTKADVKDFLTGSVWVAFEMYCPEHGTQRVQLSRYTTDPEGKPLDVRGAAIDHYRAATGCNCPLGTPEATK